METITVGNAVGASMVFGSNKYARVDMDINVAMWFLRNSQELEGVRKLFEEKRKKVFDKYSEPVDDKFRVPEEKMGDYRAEMTKLVDEFVDVEVSKISMKALSNLQISPIDLAAIQFAITE